MWRVYRSQIFKDNLPHMTTGIRPWRWETAGVRGHGLETNINIRWLQRGALTTLSRVGREGWQQLVAVYKGKWRWSQVGATSPRSNSIQFICFLTHFRRQALVSIHFFNCVCVLFDFLKNSNIYITVSKPHLNSESSLFLYLPYFSLFYSLFKFIVDNKVWFWNEKRS